MALPRAGCRIATAQPKPSQRQAKPGQPQSGTGKRAPCRTAWGRPTRCHTRRAPEPFWSANAFFGCLVVWRPLRAHRPSCFVAAAKAQLSCIEARGAHTYGLVGPHLRLPIAVPLSFRCPCCVLPCLQRSCDAQPRPSRSRSQATQKTKPAPSAANPKP